MPPRRKFFPNQRGLWSWRPRKSAKWRALPVKPIRVARHITVFHATVTGKHWEPVGMLGGEWGRLLIPGPREE